MKKDILIGGAWPYGNYLMHIGHLSALLPGDVLARFYRSCGDNVIYVSGTDCHGTPITERAKKEGKTPSEVASFFHEADTNTFNKMNFSYDMYTSTMDPAHEAQVKEYFKQIYENGYFYPKAIEQDYCEHCNKFLSDREIIGTCPHCGGVSTADQCDECLASLDSLEVKDKKCKDCGNFTTLKDNTHLYFKLSAFQSDLESYVKSNENIWRKQAYGESLKFVNMGVIDRAATRQTEWGIEVPVEGYDDKRIYVWIEAVMGYLTTAKRVCEERGIDFEKFISNDNENLISYYSHGKDNIVFHSIIYPALLLAMKNNYQLPKYQISCGYMNFNGEKMSKSKGNLVTIDELLETYTRDTIRYYIIAKGPEKNDTNYSYEDITQTHNKFLVGVLGNFVNRNLSFINKKFDGLITEGNIDPAIKETTQNLYKEIHELMETGELKASIEKIMDYVSLGNKYYDENEPWNLVKEDISKFNDVTYTCVYMIANIANLINPFMPDTAEKIKNILNLNELSWNECEIKGNIQINNLELLFNRID